MTFHSVPTLSTQVYSCATTPRRISYGKGLGAVLSCQILYSYISHLPDPRCPQDSVREQGPRIQRCQSHFSSYSPCYRRTKVLLYNFFEDSTATSAQWRLVLNMVSDWEGLSTGPTFNETRHASICIEVCYLWFEVFFSPFTRPGFAAEVLICCNHSGSEQPLDRRQF